MGESGSHLGSGGKRWIPWPKSAPIPEFQGFLSIHSLGFDSHIPKGSTFPVRIRRGGFSFAFRILPVFRQGFGNGIEFRWLQRAPGSVAVPFLPLLTPHMETKQG